MLVPIYMTGKSRVIVMSYDDGPYVYDREE